LEFLLKTPNPLTPTLSPARGEGVKGLSLKVATT